MRAELGSMSQSITQWQATMLPYALQAGSQEKPTDAPNGQSTNGTPALSLCPLPSKSVAVSAQRLERFLLNEVRLLPQDMQTRELQRAYRVVSCALQVEVARQLRKAAGLK